MIKYLYYVKNIAKRMFSFSGRASRREFIIFQIIYICLNICLILPLYLGFSSFLTFIGLILLFLKGTSGPNRYGQPPELEWFKNAVLCYFCMTEETAYSIVDEDFANCLVGVTKSLEEEYKC